MITHFTFIFLTLACLPVTYFIVRLQGYFHLCIKINEYHSLQNKPPMGENLHFPLCRTRIQESQLLFISCYCLFPGFFQASTSSFTSAFDMALFMTSHFGEQPMSLLRRSRNPAGNSVWLRDKTSKTLEGRQRKLGGTSQCFSTLRMSVRTIHSCFIQTFHTPSL